MLSKSNTFQVTSGTSVHWSFIEQFQALFFFFVDKQSSSVHPWEKHLHYLSVPFWSSSHQRIEMHSNIINIRLVGACITPKIHRGQHQTGEGLNRNGLCRQSEPTASPRVLSLRATSQWQSIRKPQLISLAGSENCFLY